MTLGAWDFPAADPRAPRKPAATAGAFAAEAPAPAEAAWRPLQNLDPRAAIVMCLGILIAVVATPAGRAGAFLADAAVLAVLLAVAGATPRQLAARLAPVAAFILLIALPVACLPAPSAATAATPAPCITLGGLTLAPANLWRAFDLAVKGLLSATAMVLLTTLLSEEALLAGLTGLGCPRLVVTLLHLTNRFGAVLQGESARMQRARLARGGRARWFWQNRSAGHLLGALFVRSLDRGERLHQAMLARGFDGVALTGRRADATPTRWTWREVLLVTLVAGALVAIRLTLGR